MTRLTRFALFLFAVTIGVLAFGALPAHALVLGEVAAPGLLQAVVLPALLRIILDPTVIAVAVALIVALLARSNAARGEKVKSAIEMAFHVVEDLKATGLLPASASKPIVAIEKLHDILGKQGITPTEMEIELAKAAWSAMHGEQKAALNAQVVPAGGAA